MFSLKYGNIQPGIGIGTFCLGMNYKEIKELIDEFEVKELPNYRVIVCDNFKIWVDKEKDTATQILVYGTFKGKYCERIGIGSTLNDVKNLLNTSWHEDLDVYILDDAPGMCFELGDSGDESIWDELTAPIETISVYATN